MRDAVRQTRSHLMALFERHGISPRSYLGQNFLIDLNLVEFIVRAAELDRRDVVLEVGAGTGGLTSFLAQRAGDVVSVEVDPNLYRLVQDVTSGFDNVTLIHGDALRNKNNFSDDVLKTIDEKLAVAPDRRLKLVANLPYNIATPVVSNLVATELPWVRMVITIQLELAQRMEARPGSSNYGALSAWLQAQCDVEVLRRLPPNVFWPRPKVNSAIVGIVPAPDRRKRIRDRRFYQDFVRRLFHQRRKFMRSILVGMYRKQLDKARIDELLAELGYAPDARAERLEPRQLVELANKLVEAIEEDHEPER